MDLKNVTVHTRADIQFKGKFIRYTCVLPDGKLAILGIILPGTFSSFFSRDAEYIIVDGAVEVIIGNSLKSQTFVTGDRGKIKAMESFTVTVRDFPCQIVALPIEN
jgi:uncharacterized protein YaiE (UPF0345 family)